MSIGENIKIYRNKKGLTQPELGKLIHKSESSIRKYESNTVTPSVDILNELANKLDVTINDLLGLNDEYSRASSLSNTYFNAVMKWSEDRSFNSIETICIREHFFELLLKYKNLINSLSNLKCTWSNIEESYSKIYKNRKDPLSNSDIKELFLKQELEKEIDSLVTWIKAFPNSITHREVELSNENKDDNQHI
ncbi:MULTISPECIES: helix-turn-helix domain-containing protein [Clostridium]|uniref:helix-turn-helix domain-containing protein n=1 Tax=Clostridium TaxID=1485 RepID=UPI000824AA47|nr:MULTISPECIES: helix-turn-helix transcriptional regulator [Clostridium]